MSKITDHAYLKLLDEVFPYEDMAEDFKGRHSLTLCPVTHDLKVNFWHRGRLWTITYERVPTSIKAARKKLMKVKDSIDRNIDGVAVSHTKGKRT